MIVIRAEEQIEERLREHAKKARISVAAFARILLKRGLLSYEQEEAELAAGPPAPRPAGAAPPTAQRRRVISKGIR